MHIRNVQHTLDSATVLWHKVSYSVLRQSSSGFRVACEIISQSSARHRYYHLKTEAEQKHSCSARAFLRPYSTLRQRSFTSKSGILHFCDLQTTKAGICSFKLLLNIFILHKQVDINNNNQKKSSSSSVLKGNPSLLLISKSIMTHT